MTSVSKVIVEVPELFSIADAAKEIGVHFTTLHRWVRSGKIHPSCIGSQLFLSKEEVEALKAERNDHAGNEPD
jgi:excisionase family DNA binding protein